MATVTSEPVAWPEPKIINPDIAQPTGVPYLDCLIHRILDTQQDLNLEANETMDQSVADAACFMDELEIFVRLVPSALSTARAEGKAEGMREAARIAAEMSLPDDPEPHMQKYQYAGLTLRTAQARILAAIPASMNKEEGK